MTHSASYAARRHERWRRNERSLDRLVAASMFESDWEKPTHLQHIPVTAELCAGLMCRYVGDRGRGDVFLRRAVDFADRLLKEQRYLDTDVAKAGHPLHYARIVAGRAYADWLLGSQLERRELRKAAEYIIEWCLTKAEDRRDITDSMTMRNYMQGVRAAMIACDLDYASELLRTQHKFRWHHARERNLWSRLIAMYPDVTEEFDAAFETFFDVVRDPDFADADEIGKVAVDRDMLALETGIIREMYIVRASPLDPVDPQSVIQAVGR